MAITIHKLDETVMQVIRDRAKARGQSVNKTIKQLLEKALGIRIVKKDRKNNPFNEFCGIWGQKDLQAFKNSVKDNAVVDPGDWQD